MDGAHANVAPSSAGRIAQCPASRVLSVGQHWADEYADNTTRDEGTAAHWVAEQYATRGIPPQIGDISPNGIAVDSDMIRHGVAFIDSVRGTVRNPVFEHRVVIPEIPDCWGTLDAGGLTPEGNIFVADYKYGFRAVQCWPNYQLALYVWGLAHQYNIRPQFARVQIHQPRAYHRLGPVRNAVVHFREVETLVNEVAQAVAIPDIAMPGEHCKYCPGRVHCSALRDVATIGISAIADSMQPLQIEQELEHANRIFAVVDAYRDSMEMQLRKAFANGYRGNKFEVVKSAGKQLWRDADTAERVALAMGKTLKTGQIATPAQARDIIGKSAVDALTTRGQSAAKIVPTSAKMWADIFKKGK